jgi:putative Holliday junction resolvase
MSPRLAQNKVSSPDYRRPERIDNRASMPHPIVPVTEATLIAIEDLPPRLAAEARLLGLDVGTKTVGMALSDITRSIATPFDTIRRTKFTADAKTIREVIEKNQVGALVIGLPINMDGSEGPRAQSTRAFARNLAMHIAMPMVFWDERLSTAAVERHLIEADASRKRRAEVVDRMAAAYILQGALDRLRRLTEQRHA